MTIIMAAKLFRGPICGCGSIFLYSFDNQPDLTLLIVPPVLCGLFAFDETSSEHTQINAPSHNPL